MADALVFAQPGLEMAPEENHRLEGFIGRERLTWPGPDIAHGHGTEPLSPPSATGFHLDDHIPQGHVGHHPATELHRGSVGVFFGICIHAHNADVCGLAHGGDLPYGAPGWGLGHVRHAAGRPAASDCASDFPREESPPQDAVTRERACAGTEKRTGQAGPSRNLGVRFAAFVEIHSNHGQGFA